MLGYELFKGLEDLSQANINYIVDVLNDFFEERSIVVTGCFLTKDDEVIATEWDNVTKNHEGKTHTGLLIDVTQMGDYSNKDGTPIFGNLFRRQDVNEEYSKARKLKELENRLATYELRDGNDCEDVGTINNGDYENE